MPKSNPDRMISKTLTQINYLLTLKQNMDWLPLSRSLSLYSQACQNQGETLFSENQKIYFYFFQNWYLMLADCVIAVI